MDLPGAVALPSVRMAGILKLNGKSAARYPPLKQYGAFESP